MVKHKLKRELGLFETTLFGVGIIVGAGIYALLGIATSYGGGAVWLSFLIAAIVAMFTGLSYAELSSMFSKDSGEYLYAEKAFGRRIAFMVGWLIIITGIITATAVGIGFANYLYSLTGFPVLFSALGIIFLMSLVNLWGIKETSGLNIFFTLAEVFGLVLIVVLGLKYFGKVDYLVMPQGIKGVFNGAALIFFAFLGFESIVKLSEETKNPHKTIPRALILSMIITTILYVLVAISAVSMVGWEALANSSAPLADVAAVALGNNGFIILGIIALFSTTNTILISLVATSRMIYGIAERKDLPKVFAHVSGYTKTPVIAVFSVMILAMIMVFVGDIELVANLTNTAVFLTFILINLSLIVLRYKMPNMKRRFKVPLNIGKFPILPVFGVVSSLFLLGNINFKIIFALVVLVAVGFVAHDLVMKKSKK